MYCTKCGAQLRPDASTCPRCGAQVHSARQAKPASRAKLAVGGAVAALLLIVAAIAVLKRGANQSSADNANLLAAAHTVQPHGWHQAAAGAPAGLFLLPSANTGFVGSWGGYVHLQPGPQNASATMQDVPMSYYLGEQNGVVFLKTSVYGDPKWPVVKSAVKVLTPTSIEFKLDSECASCTPPVKQQEVTRLTLIGNKQLEATSDSYADFAGAGHTQLSYKGTLRPMTPDELSSIDHAVEHGGKLLTTINSKQPVP